MKGCKRGLAWLMLVLALICTNPLSALADAPFEYEEGNRWGSSADRIDQYLDAAYEAYAAGDNKAAYDSVNNAYFKVYETTGFERQTMSYVSGSRKNAVELEYTTCKAAVKKTELADEPTGYLDEANENIVLELFRQLHREGTTLIVVTHDPEVAEAAQRTIVLDHGRIAREIVNESFVE